MGGFVKLVGEIGARTKLVACGFKPAWKMLTPYLFWYLSQFVDGYVMDSMSLMIRTKEFMKDTNFCGVQRLDQMMYGGPGS